MPMLDLVPTRNCHHDFCFNGLGDEIFQKTKGLLKQNIFYHNTFSIILSIIFQINIYLFHNNIKTQGKKKLNTQWYVGVLKSLNLHHEKVYTHIFTKKIKIEVFKHSLIKYICTKSSCRCWIWSLLGIVIMTFVSMVWVMKFFRKRKDYFYRLHVLLEYF